MNSSNEGKPNIPETAIPTKENLKQRNTLIWLYILLVIGVMVIGVGLVLIFLLK